MGDDHAESVLNRLRTLRRALTPYLAISAGGALGANARYFLAAWASTQWGSHFPVATLLINVSGSCVLGIYLTLVTERFTRHEATRLFVATGFLGAYTTFSTFSVEVLGLIETGDAGAGLSYVVASLVLSIVAAATGMIVAHALLSRSTGRPPDPVVLDTRPGGFDGDAREGAGGSGEPAIDPGGSLVSAAEDGGDPPDPEG